MDPDRRLRGQVIRTLLTAAAAIAVASATEAPGEAHASADAITPLRTAPVETFAVTPGFRDWRAATLVKLR